MYKNLVESYIKRMSLADLEKYISKNYPSVSKDEVNIIYKYLKTRWQELYDEDTKVLEEIQKEVSENTYQEIKKLLAMAYQFKNR